MATTWDQTSFRFRADDGTEVTAGWLAAVNASVQRPFPSLVFRIRFVITQTGVDTGVLTTPRLYCSWNGAAYAQVTGASSYLRATGSSFVSDATATTEQISGASFVAGTVDTADGACSTTATIGQNLVTELEYCVTLQPGDFAGNDRLDLKVRNDTTLLDTYTQTPAIFYSPASGVGGVAGAQFSDFGAGKNINRRRRLFSLKY